MSKSQTYRTFQNQKTQQSKPHHVGKSKDLVLKYLYSIEELGLSSINDISRLYYIDLMCDYIMYYVDFYIIEDKNEDNSNDIEYHFIYTGKGNFNVINAIHYANLHCNTQDIIIPLREPFNDYYSITDNILLCVPCLINVTLSSIKNIELRDSIIKSINDGYTAHLKHPITNISNYLNIKIDDIIDTTNTINERMVEFINNSKGRFNYHSFIESLQLKLVNEMWDTSYGIYFYNDPSNNEYFAFSLYDMYPLENVFFQYNHIKDSYLYNVNRVIKHLSLTTIIKSLNKLNF